MVILEISLVLLTLSLQQRVWEYYHIQNLFSAEGISLSIAESCFSCGANVNGR